jgi:hypothetical protein
LDEEEYERYLEECEEWHGDMPVRLFCDGFYDKLEEGCYRRLPSIGSDDAE